MTKNLPPILPIYGDQKYRNKKCPRESIEQMTFVSRIRKQYPKTYGSLIVHIQNEGLVSGGQFTAVNKKKAMGMQKGASDIIIPGKPSFLCELKRKDHTICKITHEQVDYLMAAKNAGSFVCIALGCDAAMAAFDDWLKTK